MVAEHNELVMNNIKNVQKFDITAQDRLAEHDRKQLNVPLERIIPADINKTAGVPKQLTLYIGLRVMLRYNVDVSKGLVNGSIGTIEEIEFPGWRRIQLHKEDIPRVRIQFDNDIGNHWINPITVNFDAKLGYGSVERRMLPLVPCYACTVHRLQGSTLERAVVNLGPKYFKPGQKFVALSRCKTLDGIEIDEIDPEGLLTGNVCDDEALEELERLRSLPPFDVISNNK